MAVNNRKTSIQTKYNQDRKDIGCSSGRIMRYPQWFFGRGILRCTRWKSSQNGRGIHQQAVRIVEMGPRDGLQNETNFVPTQTKVEMIKRLADCGLKSIEVASFVSPKWIPQLADSEEVMRQLQGLGLDQKISLLTLTPNLKAIERALEVGAKEVAVFGSASEGFSQKVGISKECDFIIYF